MKLLIAEDDILFRSILQRALAPEHDLILAHDGDQAWSALQAPDAPRLAILDWVMPGLSGPQICRKVRACEALSRMYLILFTARNSMADINSGLAAGADDYITKPFNVHELRARIRIGRRALGWQNSVERQSILVNYALFHQKSTGEPAISSSFLQTGSCEAEADRHHGSVIASCQATALPDSYGELDVAYRSPQHRMEKVRV